MANSTIKVGHASSSESSSANGTAGDQTEKEVRIDDEYFIGGSFKPNVVLRPKSVSLAKKSAKACEDACKNDCIGYSQFSDGGRNSLEKAAAAVNYDLTKITTNCNTDCSAFMTLCAVAGGATFSYYTSWGNAPVCSTMRNWFTQNDDYEALTATEYTDRTDFLKRGDILVDEDYHTVMVLANGSQVPEVDGTRLVVDIESISASSLSATAGIFRVTSEEELAIDDQAELESYKWYYMIKSVTDDASSYKREILEVKTHLTNFNIANLTPNTTYTLKVVAVENNGELEFSSPSVLFTTPQEYPTNVKNLFVKFDSLETPTTCTITFTEPDSWGNDHLQKCYITRLILNGTCVWYSDSILKPGALFVNKVINISEYIKKFSISPNDTIQIGIQPGMKHNNELIFDNAYLRCSQPVKLTSFLSVVDKTYLNIKNTFKRVLIHKNIQEV